MTLTSADDWLAVADACNAAALGCGSWLDALDGLAKITGSRVGQMIGFGSQNTVPFNWATELGADYYEDFVAIGGGNPAINPLIRKGAELQVLNVAATGDFITQEERRTNPFIAEHAVRHDIPHVCLTPLIKENDMMVGLAVLRSSRQGEIDDRQRTLFALIAPHVRMAVKTQMVLEHQGSQLIAGAMEALSLPVFVCDRSGLVKSMTPSAEAIVSAGNGLQLKRGKLGTANPQETRELQDAISIAAGGLIRPGAPLSGVVVVRGNGSQPMVLDVLPMPQRESGFWFEPRVLVVARGSTFDPERMKGLLLMVYRLTPAEADIAFLLAEGQSPEAIASQRGTMIGTTRMQIKAIYSKFGISRQSELVAQLNRLR